MRAKEFLTEWINHTPEFIKNINGYYDFSLLSELIEREQCSIINEIVDHELQLLSKLTTKNTPKIGDSYIPIFIIYVHEGQIYVQGSHSFATIVNIDNDIYYFDNNQSFSNERLSKNMFTKLYLFDSDQNKEKFLNIISLKFDNIKPIMRSKEFITEDSIQPVNLNIQHAEKIGDIEEQYVYLYRKYK